MDNLPVSPHATGDSNSRSTSPARPKGASSTSPHQQLTPPSQQVQPSRQNVSTGKKSEPLIGRGRRRSPVPVRKGQEALLQTACGNVASTGSVGGNVSHSQAALHSGSQDEIQGHSSSSIEEIDVPSLDSTANMSNGSSMEYLVGPGSEDFVDSATGTPDIVQRTRAAIERCYVKVENTKDMIRQEQKARDDNVNEYLKLASNADKLQLQRLKNVFEKKNQKSAQTIAQLQKKLENYKKRIKELEIYGLSSHHRQPKEVLRDVGQGLKDVGANIRGGIAGFSGGVVGNIKGGLSGLSQATHSAAESVMSKPREFAHLIKNKFGSADNINTLTPTKTEDENSAPEDGVERNHHHNSATFSHNTKYTSDDECSSVTSGSGPTAGTGTMSSPRNHPPVQASTSTTVVTGSTGGMVSALITALPRHEMSLPSVPQANVPFNLEYLAKELQEKREECQHLQEDVEFLKTQINQEIEYFNHSLLEEKYRYERLEEQMNDLTELHQNEIENLKQNISDMEEKLQYQSEERLRDIHEMMESCQTRISRIEHQQHEQQQLVALEGIENSNARALVLKLINVVLTVLQVVLLLVATATNILMPFLKTRVRILTTTIFIIAVLLTVRQWHDLMVYLRDVMHHTRIKFFY